MTGPDLTHGVSNQSFNFSQGQKNLKNSLTLKTKTKIQTYKEKNLKIENVVNIVNVIMYLNTCIIHVFKYMHIY